MSIKPSVLVLSQFAGICGGRMRMICKVPFRQITVLLLWILLVGHIQESQCFHLMMVVFTYLIAHGADGGCLLSGGSQ